MQSKRFPLLDAVQCTLVVVIAALALTGGFVHRGSSVKITLTTVDPAAISLFVLCIIRKRLSGDWFADPIRRLERTLSDQLTSAPKLALLLATSSYVFLMTWLKIWQYDSFHANAYDLGYVDQAIWCTGRCGASFRESFLASSLAMNGTYLGEHFAPILAVFSPIYSLWDSTYLLFFLQSLILASGAILIYRIARLYALEAAPSCVLSLCYLLYQPLRSANQFDFREDNLFVPLLLGMFLAAKTGRHLTLCALATLTFLVKENGSILVALLALVCLVTRDSTRDAGRSRPHLVALLAISAATFVLVNQVLTPLFSGGAGKTRFAFRMGEEAAAGGGLIPFILENPATFFGIASRNLLQISILKYFLLVFVPFFVAFRYSPIAVLAALMLFLLNVSIGGHSAGFHYECDLIPFAFHALIRTVRKIRPEMGMLILSFFLFWGKSPIHSLRHYLPNDHYRMVLAEIAKIPPRASIEAQSCLQPHLAHREVARLLKGAASADFVLADLSEEMTRYDTPNIAGDVSALDPLAYEKIVDRDGLLIFRRR